MSAHRRPLPPHGDRARYAHAVCPCHCPACTEANAAYQRTYRARRPRLRSAGL